MKKNFRELYKKLIQSKWFKKTYEDKSVEAALKYALENLI